MLQFITQRSDRFTISEEATMVINGGCRWIQVTDSTDTGISLKDTVKELRQICEGTDVFLTVENDIELCMDLKIHGVHLTSERKITPAEARDKLGPHAIIGIDVSSASEIIALKGKDIDYVSVGPFDRLGIEDIRRIISEVRTAGVEIHIVARGNIKYEDLKPLLETGISGVAIGTGIIETPDPVKETERIISGLRK